jgi:hypothetical protein
MTIQESHIYFEQVLRESNSNVFDHLDSAEIDLLLYREMLKFIGDKFPSRNINEVARSFDSTTKVDHDLQFLETDANIATLYEKDSNTVYGHLPTDFMYPTGTAVKVGCGSSSTEDVQLDIQLVPFPVTGFTQDFLIRITKDGLIFNVFKLSDYPGFTSFSEELKFYLVPAVLTGWDIYWQNSPYGHYPDHFIIPPNKNFTNIIVYQDGIGDLPVTETLNLKKYTGTSSNFKYKPLTIFDNARQVFYDDNKFTQSDIDMPVGLFRDSKVHVKHDGKFVVDSIALNYIRTPRKPSLKEGVDIEFSAQNGVNDEITYRIIERAATRAAAYISTRNYNLIKNENLS